MKTIYLVILSFLCLSFLGQVNPKSKQVKPYVKKNGTYVESHRRTEENNTNRDNYTTKPNVNPYNGKKGYKNPDNNYSPHPKKRK